MAVQETRTLPAPFIETIGQDYAKQLTALTATPINTGTFAPQVQGQDQYQKDAYSLAGQGIGSYQPFLAEAQRLGGVDPSTGQVTAAGVTAAQQPFMSPYQSQIIDQSLAEFDRQKQIREQGISDQATMSGNLGGGREGVQLAEYGAQSDRERALLQSGLLQQGFNQAQQQAGLARQNQLGLAGLVPSLQTGDISLLGQIGSTQQAQGQAQLDATRETNRMAAMEPYDRMGFYGSGVTGIMGGYPGQYQFSSMPNPTPLQTALGAGTTLAGIYGAISGKSNPFSKA
jgi:hypothetical protein|tara:strand:- start:988 stop:1845 length:858 start_codon:yes stop_codon:yes gene_type:complete